ncbi:hypothetical protein CYMTET_48003 [Cymbomonas tetramitiformis]|uniref:Uncharacterized protein n=1 Tax=Cymbomonas tetramitiformis TaxID=36881 RepID=A0AAE0EVK3_9CHLO|nr:hypothetical protein CYMTET_48003 [Cymbomonas tetramitiformis]
MWGPQRPWIPRDPHLADIFRRGSPSYLKRCLRDKRVFLLGTSFMRQIFVEMVKWLNGTLSQDYSLPDQTFKEIPSSPTFCASRRNNPVCAHGNPLYAWDPRKPPVTPKACGKHDEGARLKPCGGPAGQRSWQPTDGGNGVLHYRFKTYVDTPETDEYWIQDTKDGQYDILLVYLGQWDEMFKGRRNADELEAFRGEVRTLITKKFPGPVVWLLEPDEGKNPQRAVIQEELYIELRVPPSSRDWAMSALSIPDQVFVVRVVLIAQGFVVCELCGPKLIDTVVMATIFYFSHLELDVVAAHTGVRIPLLIESA